MKKRGRPPKLKNIISAVIEPVKKKRGRPRKHPLVSTGEPIKFVAKRGRPKKSAVIITPQKETSKVKQSETFVVGKMFIHDKRVSKQEEWFEEWHQSFWQDKGNKNWNNLLNSITKLQQNLNNILSKNENIKLSVHIPLTRLMQDDEILQVLFDPVNKGVDIFIHYRTKDFPLGLSPSLKSTAVCNKMTEILKSIVPIGVSG